MRAIIQRVKQASVTVDGEIIAEISNGILALVGFEDSDSEDDMIWCSHKIVHMRIFDDEHGIMNKSIFDVSGNILVVSQFTLFASYKKGNRPSYIRASKPEQATPKYERFCQVLTSELGKSIQTGKFGANMAVHLLNDGPTTIFIDTKNKE